MESSKVRECVSSKVDRMNKTEAIEIIHQMREEDASSEDIADALGFQDDCDCESCKECKAKGF